MDTVQITQATFDGLVIALSVMLVVQCALALYAILSGRAARKERAALHSQMFGLVNRIEGLTASEREQAAERYDRMLERISGRLRETVGEGASQAIFDAQRLMLTRLAELEPALKTDPESREKMDRLIHQMEHLEDTLVAITVDTVRRVLSECRRDATLEARQQTRAYDQLIAS